MERLCRDGRSMVIPILGVAPLKYLRNLPDNTWNKAPWWPFGHSGLISLLCRPHPDLLSWYWVKGELFLVVGAADVIADGGVANLFARVFFEVL